MTRDNVRRLDLDAAEREASGDPGGAVSDAWCECCGWRGAHDAHDPECSLFQAHAEIARLTAERDQAVAHRAATNEEIKRLHAAIKGKGFSVEDSIALHEMRSEVARLTAELVDRRDPRRAGGRPS